MSGRARGYIIYSMPAISDMRVWCVDCRAHETAADLKAHFDERARPGMEFIAAVVVPDSERTDAGLVSNPDVCCKDCKLPYESDSWADLCLDAEEWSRISPSGGEAGLLCANCMVSRAQQRGMEHVRAVWNSGPFAAPTLPQIAKPLEAAAKTLRGRGMWRLAYKMLRLRDELQEVLAAALDRVPDAEEPPA